MKRHAARLVLFVFAVFFTAGSLEEASAAGVLGSLSGTVTNANGAPLQGVAIVLSGPTAASVRSKPDGSFVARNLAAGAYRLSANQAGFTMFETTDIAIAAGQATEVPIVLQASSLTSLRVIGSTTTHSQFNSGAASQTDISQQTFVNQGRLEVNRILSQTPGVSVSIPGIYYGNGGYSLTGASPAVPVANVPQVRGALEYETATLVDGHPLSIGRAGYFDSSFLNPYLLQNVEIVKGPGANAPNINYAIGGTVNYRTLEPTPASHYGVDYGIDDFGGQFSNFRATGTVKHLGYVLDYALSGTPGPLAKATSFDQGGVPDCCGGGSNVYVNGKLLAPGYACNYSLPNPAPQYVNVYNPSCPNLATGIPLMSDLFRRAELAKIRYDFSPQTSVTTSYLGGQALFSAEGSQSYFNSFQTFAPPAGYTGPKFDPSQCCLGTFPARGEDNQGLFQTELRTAVAGMTVLGRFYQSSRYNFVHSGAGPTDENNFTAQIYGGITFAGNTTPTIFNGQTATIRAINSYTAFIDKDRLGGASLELDRAVGDNLFSLSYDQSESSSFSVFNAYQFNPIVVPSGSTQTLRTLLARAQLSITPRLKATLSNYYLTDVNKFSPDGGATFLRSFNAYDTPRVGLVYRALPGTSIRFGAGGSIAQPYLYLLSGQTGTPQAGSTPARYFTQTINNPSLRPEKGFGYNFGIDRQLSQNVIVSADVYRTNLRDQFLNTITSGGTYTGKDNAGSTVTLPLSIEQSANLGHSRYEGLELAVRRTPASGMGFVVQGALTRAYAYDLPPGFYDSPAGAKTINLGILPGTNFSPGGPGYNGLSASRIPYSQGYAEINEHRYGFFGSLGATYYGNNNPYNSVPFFVVNGTLRIPAGRGSFVQISADNLTGVRDKAYDRLDGGLPVPLANGKLGLTEDTQYGPATVHVFFHAELGRK